MKRPRVLVSDLTASEVTCSIKQFKLITPLCCVGMHCWEGGGMEGWMEGGREGWREGGMEGGMEGWLEGGSPTQSHALLRIRRKRRVRSSMS